MHGYEVLELGSPEEWLTRGKQFADKAMDTTFIGLSVNALPPGGESPFWHRHRRHEELYLFLEGSGTMGLDDEVVDVVAGTAIRVAPAVWRVLRASPEATGELRWICIRAGGEELSAIGHDGERDEARPRPWA